ncbi:hypothetical protein BGW42_007405, partial [Actinomortierella wolfii]
MTEIGADPGEPEEVAGIGLLNYTDASTPSTTHHRKRTKRSHRTKSSPQKQRRPTRKNPQVTDDHTQTSEDST